MLAVVWKKPLFLCVALLTSILFVQNTLALGLGVIQTTSQLGEPLVATINVVDSGEGYRPEDLVLRQIRGQEAGKLGFELVSTSYGMTLRVERGPGGLVIRINSRRPVHEPFINFLIELQWPRGTLYREYTVLLDPPPVKATQSSLPSSSKGLAVKSIGLAVKARGLSVKTIGLSVKTIGLSVKTIGSSVKTIGLSVKTRGLSVKTIGLPVKTKVQTQDSVTNYIDRRDEFYRVRVGDSLSAIAEHWSQGTDAHLVTTTQWLYDHNPHAFMGKNIDSLMAGVKLVMPGAGHLLKQPPKVAKQRPPAKVAEQSQMERPSLPRQDRDRITTAAVISSQASATQSLQGTLTRPAAVARTLEQAHQLMAPKAWEKPAGLLRLSQAQALSSQMSAVGGAKSTVAQINTHLHTAREVIDQLQRDNADLRKHIDALEKSGYLDTLAEVIELQMQQITLLREERKIPQSLLVADSAKASGVMLSGGDASVDGLAGIRYLTPAASAAATYIPVRYTPLEARWSAEVSGLADTIFASPQLLVKQPLLERLLSLWLPLLALALYILVTQSLWPRQARLSKTDGGEASELDAGVLPLVEQTDDGRSAKQRLVDQQRDEDAMERVLEQGLKLSVEDREQLVPLIADSGHRLDKLMPSLEQLDRGLPVSEFEDVVPATQFNIDDDMDEFFDAVINNRNTPENTQQGRSLGSNVLPFERPRRNDEDVKQSIREKTCNYQPREEGDGDYIVCDGVDGIDDIDTFLDKRLSRGLPQGENQGMGLELDLELIDAQRVVSDDIRGDKDNAQK